MSPSYDHRAWACTHTQRFPNEATARNYIDTLTFPGITVKTNDVTPLTCYHCDHGDHWHVCKVENHRRNRLGESCIDKVESLLYLCS